MTKITNLLGQFDSQIHNRHIGNLGQKKWNIQSINQSINGSCNRSFDGSINRSNIQWINQSTWIEQKFLLPDSYLPEHGRPCQSIFCDEKTQKYWRYWKEEEENNYILPIQLGDDFADSLGGAGRGGDDVLERATSVTPELQTQNATPKKIILVLRLKRCVMLQRKMDGSGGGGGDYSSRKTNLGARGINDLLGGGEGVHGGHEALRDAEFVVDDFGQGGQAVGGARGVTEEKETMTSEHSQETYQNRNTNKETVFVFFLKFYLMMVSLEGSYLSRLTPQTNLIKKDCYNTSMTNQSINRSIIKRSLNHQINQSINRSVIKSINQSIAQSNQLKIKTSLQRTWEHQLKVRKWWRVWRRLEDAPCTCRW